MNQRDDQANGYSDGQVLLLAGSGRSGTTWLAQILAANPNVRVIFEPFDPRRVPEWSSFSVKQYVRPGASHPELAEIIRTILAGEISNPWVNRLGNKWWANRRVIKSIRANLMLAWIEQRFSPRIIYLLRHPCAVVQSKLQLEWDSHLDDLLQQEELVEDYLQPFLPVITKANSEAQKHAVLWCVENMIPLRQMGERSWNVVTYEQLLTSPEPILSNLLDSLKIRRTWLTNRALRRVSPVTRPDSPIYKKGNPLQAWSRQLPQEVIREILDVVQAFNIQVYSSDPMPDLQQIPGAQFESKPV